MVYYMSSNWNKFMWSCKREITDEFFKLKNKKQSVFMSLICIDVIHKEIFYIYISYVPGKNDKILTLENAIMIIIK